MKRAKELVIISGKGGTGKTTLSGSLVRLLGKNEKVICDSDVDAADMFLLFEPETEREEDFRGKSIAVINYDKCVDCGICQKVCRFDAVALEDGKYQINPYSCDGCTYCMLACPAKAISMEQQVVGKWFISNTDSGSMVHARLKPGAENSGNLVTMVKHQSHLLAEENGISLILIDGPPGIGCPVTSAISGANLAVIVTEPTFSGIHDLERVLGVTGHFQVSSAIVINKYDMNEKNSRDIERFAKEKDIPLLGKIPLSTCVMDAITRNKTPVDSCPDIKSIMEDILGKIKKLMDIQ